MSKVSVPPKRLDSVRLIAGLQDDAVKDLFAAIARCPPTLYQTGLAENVASDVKSIPHDDVVRIVDTLLSMYPALVSANKSVDGFVANLADSLRGTKGWGDQEISQLRINLDKLLRVPTVSLGAKATNLLFQNERSLSTSRIVTDIRPVFELDNEDVGGGVIVHTLKLEYFSDGNDEEKTFYVSLDASDIDELIDVLDRARRKGQKLRAILEAASVPVIDEGEK